MISTWSDDQCSSFSRCCHKPWSASVSSHQGLKILRHFPPRSPPPPPILFLLAWTDYSCPQPHLEVALLCHGLSSACQSSWWWLSVWVLPRLVILKEVRAHLGSSWKRKKSPLFPCAFSFLVGHKVAHVLFRNLFWLVLSAYSSFPFLQKDFNPSKR